MSIEIIVKNGTEFKHIYDRDFCLYVGKDGYRMIWSENKIDEVFLILTCEKGSLYINQIAEYVDIELNGIMLDINLCNFLKLDGNNIIKILNISIFVIVKRNKDECETTEYQLENNVELPYICSEYATYPYHTAMLGVLSAFGKEREWLFNNYILLWLDKTGEFVSYWYDFKYERDEESNIEDFCPYIEVEEILRYDKYVSIKIKENIRKKKYVYLTIDTFYVDAYWEEFPERMHSKHQVLVFGYNDDVGVFYIADFFSGKYKKISLVYDIFEQAYWGMMDIERKSVQEYGDKIKLLKYRKESYDINCNRIKNLIRDYIKSQDTTIHSYLNGTYFTNKIVYGIMSIDYYIDYVNKCVEHLQVIDRRFFFFLFLQNKIMLERFQYLAHIQKISLCADFEKDLNILVAHSSILVNLVLKYNVRRQNHLGKNILSKLISIKDEQCKAYRQCIELL